MLPRVAWMVLRPKDRDRMKWVETFRMGQLPVLATYADACLRAERGGTGWWRNALAAVKRPASGLVSELCHKPTIAIHRHPWLATIWIPTFGFSFGVDGVFSDKRLSSRSCYLGTVLHGGAAPDAYNGIHRDR